MRRVRVLTPSSDGRSVSSYVHMTVLAVRYEAGDKKRRFERRDESRMMQLEQLRERIERDEYAIDPQKVAEAVLRRLMDVAAPRRG
jgi:anti-sigma28 factor (negative regulator of flagellin synthesis)